MRSLAVFAILASVCAQDDRPPWYEDLSEQCQGEFDLVGYFMDQYEDISWQNPFQMCVFSHVAFCADGPNGVPTADGERPPYNDVDRAESLHKCIQDYQSYTMPQSLTEECAGAIHFGWVGYNAPGEDQCLPTHCAQALSADVPIDSRDGTEMDQNTIEQCKSTFAKAAFGEQADMMICIQKLWFLMPEDEDADAVPAYMNACPGVFEDGGTSSDACKNTGCASWVEENVFETAEVWSECYNMMADEGDASELLGMFRMVADMCGGSGSDDEDTDTDTDTGSGSCVDAPGTSGEEWTDGNNFCHTYATNNWCSDYGGMDWMDQPMRDFVLVEGTANEQCCVCGGGVNDEDTDMLMCLPKVWFIMPEGMDEDSKSPMEMACPGITAGPDGECLEECWYCQDNELDCGFFPDQSNTDDCDTACTEDSSDDPDACKNMGCPSWLEENVFETAEVWSECFNMLSEDDGAASEALIFLRQFAESCGDSDDDDGTQPTMKDSCTIDQTVETTMELGPATVSPLSEFSSPGTQSVPCPKGYMGSLTLLCMPDAAGRNDLQIAAERCQPIPADVCDAFGAACFGNGQGPDRPIPNWPSQCGDNTDEKWVKKCQKPSATQCKKENYILHCPSKCNPDCM